MKSALKDRVLIIDDEPEVARVLSEFLRRRGCEPIAVSSCSEAEKFWESAVPDLAILDYRLPDGNALTLMPRLRAINAAVPLIILTGHGSIDLAVEAIKRGAEQFLTKPIDLPLLWVIVQRTLENNRNQRQQRADKTRRDRNVFNPFLGRSDEIRRIEDLARKIARSDHPVFIFGETGTGKSILARWLHQNGARSMEPFVDLNCAGLSSEVLESELFGHERDAFSGALQTKVGLLEIAHKGTILLDEIADVNVQVQPKLLKVLEEKQFRRIGDLRDRRVNIRLMAATNQNMNHLIRGNRFRADLYFRISTISLFMPPLRDRTEDIPILAEHILENIADSLGKSSFEITGKALQALQSYQWPGNIRELRNMLERAILISGTPVLSDRDLHFDVRPDVEMLPASFKNLHDLERRYIEQILMQERGKVELAAKKLGMPRSSLYYKIKQYQINPAAMRTPRQA
jgi:DNA-binding NtrC family response regulator